MKLLIKLLIVAAVLHAVVRAGLLYWSHYQLKDAAQQAVVFGAGMSEGELLNEILRKAAELEIPLAPGDVAVSRQGQRTTAAASYVRQFEYLPTMTYPVRLSFEVDAQAVRPVTAKDILP
ncbi:MAG TPA: hypothetical protein VNK41_05950 [Vicinamibacterales bacterium]|nr:hypothetical protein [Vicinamibacterales bacterium]